MFLIVVLGLGLWFAASILYAFALARAARAANPFSRPASGVLPPNAGGWLDGFCPPDAASPTTPSHPASLT